MVIKRGIRTRQGKRDMNKGGVFNLLKNWPKPMNSLKLFLVFYEKLFFFFLFSHKRVGKGGSELIGDIPLKNSSFIRYP